MSKRNTILATATRLFSRNGLQGSAVAELSALTGAATGTIFHHFKNKEDLFVQVVQGIKENILDGFERQRRERRSSSGLERVLAAVADYVHLAGTMEDQFLILHRHDPYQLAETNPECRGHLEDLYTGLLDVFEADIQEGVADGSIQTDDPRKTAMMLFAMVDGIVRLNTYRIYDAGTLVDGLLLACRKVLGPSMQTP